MKVAFLTIFIVLELFSGAWCRYFQHPNQFQGQLEVNGQQRLKRQNADYFYVDYMDAFAPIGEITFPVPQDSDQNPIQNPNPIQNSNPIQNPNPMQTPLNPMEVESVEIENVVIKMKMNEVQNTNIYKPYGSFEEYYETKFLSIAENDFMDDCDRRLQMCMLGQDAAKRYENPQNLKSNLVYYFDSELYNIFFQEAGNPHTPEYCWDQYNCIQLTK